MRGFAAFLAILFASNLNTLGVLDSNSVILPNVEMEHFVFICFELMTAVFSTYLYVHN